MTGTAVGIDDLNLAAGQRCIELAALAACGRHRASDLATAGFERRSVLDVWQDPVTLAVDAARPLLDGRADEVGLLLVGTESGVDFAKPVSSYVHSILQLPASCRNAEIKHACYGATLALRLACSWVREHPGQRALVVATDICRRNGDLTELAGGIGAVAMTVTANPRVLEVDPLSGCAAHEVWDVARPTPAVEHIDPSLSLSSYLDLLESAWADLTSRSDLQLASLQNLVYHCPVVSLIRQAHSLLVGDLDDFDDRVEPSLSLVRQLGNVFGGSVFAGLLGVIETRDVPSGAQIGVFSYGSGACAEFWTGRMGSDPLHVRRHEVTRMLASRSQCSVEEWVAADAALHGQLTSADLETHPPSSAGCTVLERIVGWHRKYRCH